MANIHFQRVGIKAIAACVPKKIEKISDLTYLMNEKEIEAFSKGTGIVERHILESEKCTSDLCYSAAKRIFEEKNVSPDSIDALLFMSKTPDYIIPTTSALLQNRLGLRKDALCIDLRLACSGYIYGLSTAYAYATQQGINRVLLLAGDANSKIVSKYDKSCYPVFGDGGSATLIEKGNFSDSFFNLGTDGNRGDFVVIPCENGGRNPISEKSLLYEADDFGNKRNALQMNMKGMDVFSFAISTVPKSIKSLLEYANMNIDDFDAVFIHQANKLILQTIAKKLKIPMSKLLINIDHFGNTSSASIPLLFASEVANTNFSGNFLLSGFGSGLSWGSMVQKTNKISVYPIIAI